jgi:hypothetical protein
LARFDRFRMSAIRSLLGHTGHRDRAKMERMTVADDIRPRKLRRTPRRNGPPCFRGRRYWYATPTPSYLSARSRQFCADHVRRGPTRKRRGRPHGSAHAPGIDQSDCPLIFGIVKYRRKPLSRTSHQSQDCQSNWPRNPALALGRADEVTEQAMMYGN